MAEIGKKLQLKPDSILLLFKAPEQVVNALAAENCTFDNVSEISSLNNHDAVLLFVRSKAEVDRFAPQVVSLLKANAPLWFAFPKKSSGIKTDISRDEGWEKLAELKYSATRLVALDDVWSAVRYRHETDRTKPSTFGLDLPGIDRKAKTVMLPEDMQVALEEAGLLEGFNRMAFSYRKEYTTSVLEAKRSKTRTKRITKMIEALQAKQSKV